MQIGTFARICGTQISVLRHYDKINLLKPSIIDQFTGYRYYDAGQEERFRRISALKDAGFSLGEIKAVLNESNFEKTKKLFELKKKSAEELILKLETAEKLITDKENDYMSWGFTLNQKQTASIFADKKDLDDTFGELDSIIIRLNYQRVSSFRQKDADNNTVEIIADIVKLQNEKIAERSENTDISFENDPEAGGKWQILGEFASRDCFPAEDGKMPGRNGGIKEIYFLPDGQNYWVFGWTKGYLKFKNGDYSALNCYKIETIGKEKFMFVEWKSYAYMCGGKETLLVLKQLDAKEYTIDEISRKDDINKPFVNDAKVIGKWNAIGYVHEKEDFTGEENESNPFYSSAEFLESGVCVNKYGNNSVSDTWTLGYILDKRDKVACVYEIKNINGKDYLFVEWKSGDYIWGGYDPTYYVFSRES